MKKPCVKCGTLTNRVFLHTSENPRAEVIGGIEMIHFCDPCMDKWIASGRDTWEGTEILDGATRTGEYTYVM